MCSALLTTPHNTWPAGWGGTDHAHSTNQATSELPRHTPPHVRLLHTSKAHRVICKTLQHPSSILLAKSRAFRQQTHKPRHRARLVHRQASRARFINAQAARSLPPAVPSDSRRTRPLLCICTEPLWLQTSQQVNALQFGNQEQQWGFRWFRLASSYNPCA